MLFMRDLFEAASSEETRKANDRLYVEKMVGTTPTQIQDAKAQDEAFEWVSVIHPLKAPLSLAA